MSAFSKTHWIDYLLGSAFSAFESDVDTVRQRLVHALFGAPPQKKYFKDMELTYVYT